MLKDIIIYTDGSSLGNPGPAGWGAVILVPDQNNSKLKIESEKCKVIELGGREKSSTNNRMEMMAVIQALKIVQKRKFKAKNIEIYSDSAYLLNGITLWIYGWVKNNWQTKNGTSVLNKDLWEELYKVSNDLTFSYKINWIKVAGHSGIQLNERCDAIANSWAANNTTILFTGNLKDYQKLFGEITFQENSIKSKNKKKNKKEAYAYVFNVDGKIGTVKTWADCQKKVTGKSKAKYQKVFSKTEEQDLIAQWTLNSLL